MASRFEYKAFSDEARRRDESLTSTAQLLEAQIEECLPKGREQALALTKLEETVMWIRKGLRDVK